MVKLCEQPSLLITIVESDGWTRYSLITSETDSFKRI